LRDLVLNQTSIKIEKNMKKFIVSIMLLLPLGLVAQDLKIAIVNTNEIFNVMPEVSTMENEIMAMTQQYEKELQIMQDEYTRKYSDLTAQQDSLTDNIRMIRVQEIQDIQARIENFIPMANEARNKKQEELMTPIREKIQKAIDQVGEENNYTYILNPGALLYMSKSSAIDATAKVKAKMGLK
jgi:outer membrane protein